MSSTVRNPPDALLYSFAILGGLLSKNTWYKMLSSLPAIIDRHLSKYSRLEAVLLRCIGAFSVVGTALLARYAVHIPILPFLFFVPAVMASSFIFGISSGAVATIISVLASIYFFLEPYYSFHLHNHWQLYSVFFFAIISSGIALVCAGFRSSLIRRDRAIADLAQAENQLRDLNATLESRVQEEVLRRSKAEDALRQSQKMEAVGQLTGGLAHDFNNLLTGITGSLDLLDSRLKRGKIENAERYITTAQSAAARAAALTHRLLAFSRRQTLEPKVLDVSALVAGMDDMLRRTLGPSVNVEIEVAPDLWGTRVDPSQLENALLNLCINSRDAMPNGGTILIKLENRVMAQSEATERDLTDLNYVRIEVTDNGLGMEQDVLDRIFEPFFTTKPIGMGTGLGLSMIYGFARQSGGQIRAHSTPGLGTRMCLLLPRHVGAIETPVVDRTSMPEIEERSETILVVDDEESIRTLIVEVLRDAGFNVLEAKDGAGGLAILRSDMAIDLLVTDVGLPGGMNGRQMADAGRTKRQEMPILFITGYAETTITGTGSLEPKMHILTKPFSMATLEKKIATLL